jgi:ABC-type Na+ efflux pump permease subunit
MVATNVASEKDSRAMELLITSAKPTSMMFGKVLASCLAGLTQIVCIFGSAFLFYQINQNSWGDNPIIASLFYPQFFLPVIKVLVVDMIPFHPVLFFIPSCSTR